MHAVSVFNRVTGVYCVYNGSKHFDSASIVKAIIMAALLRWHQETKTPLSAWEKSEATLMITQSDNDAASDLWDELGMGNLQHFLNLADMGETQLGQDGEWGLTQVTAHDEMLLLKLLTAPNSVLDAYSRSYQLGLMAKVTSWEAWGVTAGTPSGVTWHVKNGWLPDATGWHINSIGTFSGHGKNYMIAVLSDNTDMNDDEQYGINTIEDVARLVQHDLNDAKLTGSRRPRRDWPLRLTRPFRRPRGLWCPRCRLPLGGSPVRVGALPDASVESGACAVDGGVGGGVSAAVSRKTTQRSMQ